VITVKYLRSSFFKYDPAVYKEISGVNLHRMVVMGCIMGLINIIHIIFFGMNFPSHPDHVVQWYKLVVIIHMIMLFFDGAMALLAYLVKKKNMQNHNISYVLHCFSILGTLSFGILLCVIDQLITTSVNPLFIASIGVGVVYLMPPLVSAVCYLITFVSFTYLVTWTQQVPELLVDLRINGVVATGVGFGVSWLLWRGHIEKIKHLAIIENQRRSLEESNKNLKQALSDYNLIAEYSSDLISVIGEDCNTVFLSRSHQTILGLDPVKYIGRNTMEFIHPDDMNSLVDAWYKAIQDKKSTVVYRFRHAEGHWVWLESHFVPVINEKGENEKFIMTSRDITERKYAEEMLRETDRLSVAGQLAAGISHEIRNPLTTLKGFTQLIKTDSSILSNNFLDIMMGELDRIDLITNEFLFLAKPQAMEKKEISIHDLLYQTKALLQPEATLKNIDFNVEIAEHLPSFQGVENQLKQVCINLLKNAIDAMPKGGTIFMEAQRESDETLRLSIKDQGIGITKERMEKLGEPFYSLKEKGTGLGLTVCKKIIQDHNGTIEFHSIVGEGTTVEVRLPLFTTAMVS